MKPIPALVACVLCLCSWLAYADKTMTIHVSRSDSMVKVTLPANPTTGYQWTIKQYNHSFLQLKSQRYIAPHNHLVGAGGHENFVFQLLKGKSYLSQTDILFNYARSWEPGSSNLTKVIVKFD